jgi:hypothetical protein
MKKKIKHIAKYINFNNTTRIIVEYTFFQII